MAKYAVYGLGNALVDYEIEVSEAFLEAGGIQKGVMELVDEAQQQATLARVEGERHNRSCGGSAANTIIGVAQLGGKVFYSCRVANDETGDFFLDGLSLLGVDSNSNPARQAGDSGKCIVMVTPDADRTMQTCLGISAELNSDDIDEKALANSDYLYIEGYLVSSDSARQAAIKAKSLAEKHRVKTAFTLSDPAMAEFFNSGMQEMIGEGVDLLFCNAEEAMTFTKTEDLNAALEGLKPYAKNIAITLGEKGALLYDGSKTINISSPKVTAIDTNGAGDLFAGGVLYGLTHGMSFTDSATLACRLSSHLVTQFGARLPADQTKEIYLASLG